MQNNVFVLLCFLSCSSTESDGKCLLTFNEISNGLSLRMVRHFRGVILVFGISPNKLSERSLPPPFPGADINGGSENSLIIWFSVNIISIF